MSALCQCLAKAVRSAIRAVSLVKLKLIKKINACSYNEKVNKHVNEKLLTVKKRITDTLDLLLACELKKNNWPACFTAAKSKAPDDDESSESESNKPDCFTPEADDENEQMKSQ
ncbi:MAG: hypothetical protein M1835_004312 [Candelina submexicana]|nr:MAG: hypothetical protein M1835_004312 [Candelina submexicana]